MPVGRRPVPTKLKLITGNPGRRPLNHDEPKPQPVLPPCPPELSASAKREWRRVARELHRLGLLTRIDRAALAAYCQAWGEWLEAITALQRTGTIVRTPSGYPILNPNLTVANQAFARIKAIATEFGMTPAARSRVSASPLDTEPDPADWYFNDRPRR